MVNFGKYNLTEVNSIFFQQSFILFQHSVSYGGKRFSCIAVEGGKLHMGGKSHCGGGGEGPPVGHYDNVGEFYFSLKSLIQQQSFKKKRIDIFKHTIVILMCGFEIKIT